MTPRNRWSYRQLLAALLLAGGATSIALPLLAQTAQIGDQIRNTFTGTFQDNNGQELPPVTSNEVVLVVAEVAGLTVQSQAPSKANPDPNDTIYVDFVITNVGNDPTQVFIPDRARISDPPGKTGSGSYTQGTLQVIEFNGTTLPTPVNVPTNGENSGNFPTTLPNGGALNPGQTVRVRVPLTVQGTALKNDSVLVSLGNTAATANQQNIVYTNDVGSVYTNNIPDGGAPGEAPGNPVNGQREAMDTSQVITVGARLQAFGTILLAKDYSNGNTPGNINDDRITYNLATRIESAAPAGIVDIVPSPLCQTQVRLEGATVNRVLVSDAIPTDTVLSNAAPIPATDGVWEVVYTTSPLTVAAHQADWSATRPAANDQITRIGFMRDACLPTGQTINGFSFVVEPRPGFTGGRIVNIAQLFGQSTVGTPVADTATQLVYDESGDQDPNNGLGASNPDPLGGTPENNGGIMARAADIALDGTDPGRGTSPIANDTNQGVNTGTTAGSKPAGGETSVQTLSPAPANGPQDQPSAIGPKNTEDDFTNIILAPPAAIPATQKLDDAQTPPVVFTNTVKSFSTIAQDILLLPQAPEVKTSLPDGTKVTITNPINNQSATYSYSAANGFTFLTGQGVPTATQPVLLNLAPGANGSYQVTVDLPNAEQVKEYPVPILAFIDQGTPGYDINDPGNVTIDRIYTGYIQVVKEARIIEDDGTTEIVPFTTDTAKLAEATQVDRFVEYRLTYTNISITPGNGSNNVVLPATDFTIVDDGAAAPNNWFSTTTDPAFPAQPKGSASSSSGQITVTTTNNNIQTYSLTVPTLNPGESGTLTFRRKIQKP